MPKKDADVIIIGAGLAGLSAGVKLVQQGYSVTIILGLEGALQPLNDETSKLK